MSVKPDGECWAARIQFCWVADSVQPQSGNFAKTAENLLHQIAFMRADSAIGRLQHLSARRGECPHPPTPDEGVRGYVFPPQLREILYASRDASDALVTERAPLPALRNGVGVGADFVGLEPRKVLTLAVQNAHVRTKEFVS